MFFFRETLSQKRQFLRRLVLAIVKGVMPSKKGQKTENGYPTTTGSCLDMEKDTHRIYGQQGWKRKKTFRVVSPVAPPCATRLVASDPPFPSSSFCLYSLFLPLLLRAIMQMSRGKERNKHQAKTKTTRKTISYKWKSRGERERPNIHRIKTGRERERERERERRRKRCSLIL